MNMFFSCNMRQLWQTIWSFPALVALVLMLSLTGASSPVFAVHDVGLFELDIRAGVEGDQDKRNDPPPAFVGDGNTIDEAATGEDWANIYLDFLGTPSSAEVIAWIEDTFANNPINSDAEAFVVARTPEISFYTGGGSKDVNGIQDGPWLYKIVSDQVPDKNDIVNAFAALYTDPGDGHAILYFGLDTYSVNGDANAGFWFFRQDVGLADLAEGETTGGFTGEHSDGDIFVAVAYTEGGRIGDIDVFKWVGDDATGALVLQLSGQDCADVAAGDDVCGVINKLMPDVTFGEDPSFDYANTLVANNPDITTDPTSYQYESAAFVEFGLDLTEILGQEIGCFSTFLAESRSSQSVNAQLKDFALGDFDVCSIEVDKTGDTLSKVGDDVDYTITVKNTGLATLHKQSIIDSVFGDLTDGTNAFIISSTCGATLAANDNSPGGNDECTINVTRTVVGGDPDPLDNTVTIVYSEFADPASLSFTDNDDHSVNLFQPSVTLAKTGDTLSKVGDSVDYTITVNNTSSADTPNLECTISDALLGLNKAVTLASGASDVTNASRAVQGGDPDPLVNTASVSCSPIGFSNILPATDNHSVNLFQPSITLAKTGDTLSKVGDSVAYTITLSNTSSADTPNLECTVTDTLLGVDKSVTLASGGSDVTNASRTVQGGDPDPLVNVANASCSPIGFPNVLPATDNHSVNLFQPSITLAKTGDTLSKVGDSVDYTITLNNTSSADTPDMECTVTDTLLGVNKSVTLVSGANDVTNASRAVQGGDPDPLVNVANASCSPIGFPNVLPASDNHSVNLFQPSISLAKTGDTLSKVGDSVDYTITLNNTSSADTPDMECTVTDTLLGVNKSVTLASGGSDVTNQSRSVQGGDPDPLVNVANASCSPIGFPNVLPASDNHSVNLFQPSISLAKTGDATLSKVGDSVGYTITLNNTSSADTPDLECTVTDTLLGVNKSVTLASGGNDVTNASRTVQGGDPDPLVNVANANCSPIGFPNVLPASDNHSVNLFQPSISLAKTGDTLSKVGDSVDYTITLNNTSSADTPDMECTVTDTLLGVNKSVTLASGANDVTNASRAVQGGDPDPLVNVANASCSPIGFPNVLPASDNHSVNLFQPSISLAKTGDATLSKVGDSVGYTITLNNTSSADTPDMECTVTDTLLGVNKSVTLASGGNDVTNASRTVQGGDPDPLVNVANASCSPIGFPNVLPASDNHSVNLFQPSISLAKTGDTLSKVGDSVAYTITLNNTSSADTPDMECTVTDTLLGVNKAVTLASGGSDVTNQSRSVQGGDPDPLVNVANASCSPIGFPNVLPASDNHSVNLFQPSISLAKTGDATLSKVGDSVAYTITLNNTSSADTPDLECTVTDTLLGVNKSITLASGGNDVTNASRTVQGGDPDPLVNVANASCSPIGFPNVLPASDNHSVNLFQPNYALSVSCPATDVEAGDDVVYSLTISNNGSADSPVLQLVGGSDQKSITFDPIIQNLNIPLVINGALPASLASGNSATVSFSGTTIAAGDYKGMASATYSPAGFPNQLARNAMDTCNVLAPAPALLILEKLLLNGELIPWTFNTTGEVTSTDVLTPVLNSTEIVLSPFDQTFDATSNGFDRMDGAISVPIPTNTSTVTVMVEEVLQLGINFVGLECTINDDSGRDGDISFGGSEGQKATLMLGDADLAECRWTNSIPGEGCTPGFWRNHLNLWDGQGGDDISTANIGDLFNATFGVTSAESGLDNSVTLEDTINLGGGNKRALARHATAAYISASATGIDFAFSPTAVISIYQDGVDAAAATTFNLNVAQAKNILAAENEKGCPFN